MSTVSETVAAVRDFNRFYTNATGILRERQLGTDHSLAEARVIYELGQGEETETGHLREVLGLDRGYVSRILARCEADGLILRSPSPADARRHTIALTAKGRKRLATLQRRSDEQVGGLIAALDETRRRRLVGAMAEVRRLLEPPPGPRRVVLRELRMGDLGWVVERHGVLYAEEFGWDERFEGLVAGIASAFVERPDPRRERGWAAEVDGERAGAVFCTADDERTARLRMLFVEPTARGAGVGGALIEECVAFARGAGYDEMVLWTTDQQTGARRLYADAGFERTSERPDPRFDTEVTSEDWRLALRP